MLFGTVQAARNGGSSETYPESRFEYKYDGFMNDRDDRIASQTGEWATRQLADYDARTPGSIFGEGTILSVAEGYGLQSAVASLRCERGERVTRACCHLRWSLSKRRVGERACEDRRRSRAVALPH